jgi:LytS/YehU family sensor histidine kinase
MLALVCVYESATTNFKFSNHTIEIWVSGIAIGLITIVILSNPINLYKGIFVDARWVLLSCCAMFLNWRIVVIGGIIGASYRYYQGGAGGVPGVYTVVVAILVGMLWRYALAKYKVSFKWYVQYIFSITVELAILGLLYVVLPGGKGPIVVSKIAMPLLVLFPVVSVILTLLLQQHRSQDIESFK